MGCALQRRTRGTPVTHVLRSPTGRPRRTSPKWVWFSSAFALWGRDTTYYHKFGIKIVITVGVIGIIISPAVSTTYYYSKAQEPPGTGNPGPTTMLSGKHDSLPEHAVQLKEIALINPLRG